MTHDILAKLKRAIMEYDAEGSADWARRAVEEGIDPVKAADAMTEAIRQVGDAFGRGELFIPDLIMAAKAMKRALPIIDAEIQKRGGKRKSAGTIVIGTVAGDLHDIGKNIVATMFAAAGFEVVDLGVQVPSEKFLEAVKEHKPDILGLSALLTMTAPEQRKILEHLKKAGLREKVKVIVGGGAIDRDWAEKIGADGFGANAIDAVKEARKLIGAAGGEEK